MNSQNDVNQENSFVREMDAAGFELVWDLARDESELYARVRGSFPAAEYESYRTRFPVADTYLSFESEDYFRPPGHSRAFYRRYADGDCIAFKGSECFVPDILEAVGGLGMVLTLPAIWNHSAQDYFVLIEKALPLALGASEVLLEVRNSAAFQRSYTERYGKLASIPLPLSVFRFPEEIETRMIESYRPFLSPRAFEIAEKRVREGLVCYMYYLPGTPVRLKFTRGSSAGEFTNFEDSLAEIKKFKDPAALTGDWFRLVARMLALGFMPAREEDLLVGGCLMPHNTTMGGGFCDTGALRSLSSLRDDRELHASLHAVTAWLAWSSKVLLLTSPFARAGFGYHRGWHFSRNSHFGYIDVLIHSFIRRELGGYLRREAEDGLLVDERFLRYFSADMGADALFGILEGFYPGTDEDLGCLEDWRRTFSVL